MNQRRHRETRGSGLALLAAVLGALLACKKTEEQSAGPTTKSKLAVSCLNMVIDGDPLVAHTPPAVDDQGQQVHACELHFSTSVAPNGVVQLKPSSMRFHALGHWWRTIGGHLGVGTESEFDVTIEREDCPGCGSRSLSGPYSYCDLRNGQGCAFEACRSFAPEVGTCAAHWASGLSRKVAVRALPYPRLSPSPYGRHDLRLLAEGEATACRALVSRSSGGLQVDLQFGTWNRVDVSKLFGQSCAAGQAANDRFTFRMGGVTGAGTYGPVTTSALAAASGVVRLPEISWPIPVAFLSMRTPSPDACDDHGAIELEDGSSCTLALEANHVALDCERARYRPPASPLIPAYLAETWGFDAPPEMLVRFQLEADCDLREVP